MKTHLSATQIANLQLSCLPKSARGIADKAKREQWSNRPRAKKGGGIEYAIASLPEPIQTAVIEAQKSKLLSDTAPPPSSVIEIHKLEELPASQHQRNVEGARMGVLNEIENLAFRAQISRSQAINAFLIQARLPENGHLSNMLKLATDPRGGKHTMPTSRTIFRWFNQRDERGLIPQSASFLDAVPSWAEDFLSVWQQPQKPSISHAYELFCAIKVQQEPLVKLPSIHQVRRFIGKLGNVAREKGRMGAREIKKIKPYTVRNFAQLDPCDIYTADGHTFDAEILHPASGKPFRPEITTIADVATRKIVGFSVDLAESGLAVLAAISHACETNGVAAIFYVDNGGGYKNAMMRDEASGLMGRLGMSMIHSLPYASQARGVIERLHQTVWVEAAKSLQSYMGADMDAEARQMVHKNSRQLFKKGNLRNAPALANIQNLSPHMMMDFASFVRFCEAHVERYNNRPHRSLPKVLDINGKRRHMTPNEQWALKIEQGAKLVLLEEDEKHHLFMPQEMRVVQRGQVFLHNNRYFSQSLEEFNGDTVRVAYDIHDAEHVWIYNDVGYFICRADWNANSVDYMPKALIEQKKEARIDAQVKRKQIQIADIEAARATTVIEHQENINIGGFTIARETMTQKGAEALQRMRENAVCKEEVIEQTAPALPETGFCVPETAEARFALFGRLKDRENLPERAKKWLKTYPTSNEYKAMCRHTQAI